MDVISDALDRIRCEAEMALPDVSDGDWDQQWPQHWHKAWHQDGGPSWRQEWPKQWHKIWNQE